MLVVPLVLFAPSAPASGQERVDLGLYAGPIRLVGGEDTTHTLAGPLDTGSEEGRYAGTLEFRAAGGGLTAISDVTLRTYLEGIAEVPLDWPREALRAQAVAARTYAWYSMRLATYEARGYDICATVACQVYRGRAHLEDPDADRWREAVASTEGQVLLHDGEPILARYFSTSGGRTRANEEVFPGEGAYPYLEGVEDPEDAVSPLHRWEVRFTREQMDAILAEGQQLRRAVPVASFEVIPADGTEPDRVRAISVRGDAAVVRASDFRQFVSAVAPDLFPEVFPSARRDGLPLPMTLPSSRFEIEAADDEFVVRGRGFGHGVGMSQYGAKGKAEAGMSYDDILAAYYSGLRPQRPESVPGRIRVGLADDAAAFGVRPDEPVAVRAGDRVITDRGLGTWRIESGPDRTLRLLAPPGYGAPLVAAGTSASLSAPSEVHVVDLDTVVNKPAEVFLTVVDAAGDTVVDRRVDVVDPGRHTTRWSLEDGRGSPLRPGIYDVRLRAVDETGDEDGGATTLHIRSAANPAGPPESILGPPPVPVRRLPWTPLVAVAAAGALAGVVLGRRAGAERGA